MIWHQDNVHDERQFKCETCGKESVGLKELRNHEKTHKATSCKYCGVSIPQNSLTSHTQKCIPQITFNCDKCRFKTNIQITKELKYFS